jgi:hypothetical protein
MTIAILLIIGLFITRAIETLLFIRKVSKACYKYDWKFVNDGNDLLLLEMMQSDDYYVSKEWSAYNFLYLNGPSPLFMFLSCKRLTIKNLYNEDVVNRIKKYEII